MPTPEAPTAQPTPAVSRAVIRDTTAIAVIPAPTGLEGDRMAWLERRLQSAPGLRSRDEVGNLIWRIGPAGTDGPQDTAYDVLLLVHVDTVFDASVPHVVTERDGWLCGPGVGDNSVAIAAAVNVVESLELTGDASLAVAFTVGEEGLGSLRGARHACATIAARQVIALEGHGLDSVFVDAVGCVRAAITVTGPGGHSWWDRGRPSATHDLVHLLAELLDAAPAEVAVNIGTVGGGSAVNAIAASARAVVEARSLDQLALVETEKLLAEIGVDLGTTVDVEILDRRPAGRLDHSHPLVGAVLAEREALGLAANLTSGSTDANAALALRIPALAIGCARGADMHAEAERIDISSLPLGIAQLDRVLRTLLAERTTTTGKA